MTNEELDRLEALANAAAPGPWPVVIDKPYKTAPESEWYARLGTEMIWGDSVGEGYFSNVADAQFIAAARDALPELVAEVRRLRALVEAAYLEGHEAGWDGREPFGDVWQESRCRKALNTP